MDLNKMMTETRNPDTMHLDEMSALEIVTAMNREDRKVPEGIEPVLPQIAAVVETVEAAFRNGGRLFYLGAGTSGRLGVLDASECPPTFGVEPGMVVGLIAGGDRALRFPIEGAEDSRELGRKDLEEHDLCARDVVVGIAASGRTPYVLGALDYARSIGCKTAAIACNNGSAVGQAADIAIEAQVGPEVLTGSTRLKAGTAQKMILNMITTGAMVRIGKAYQNLMVDVVQSNEKLETRAENIVMAATGVERSQARQTIDAAGGKVKLAITMILTGRDVEQAAQLLEEAGGRVRDALRMK
ncbi:MAG TPA: N-acetylmuramic acid 6-phosphate etherase [Candidatus Gemmiger excrementigallinarum]|uniref:N-acetylmuramic acid 6-phosphate etherase n=1 Tax=Candidatus Gemmiger excrementigallinarum TaxID=2838609 RepID=A0A9D2EQ39_9FIRM|nr:N-acetylmuramic acid 6-phosphate etherase [Candidatus Gemmiger excrementigallinarum]